MVTQARFYVSWQDSAPQTIKFCVVTFVRVDTVISSSEIYLCPCTAIITLHVSKLTTAVAPSSSSNTWSSPCRKLKSPAKKQKPNDPATTETMQLPMQGPPDWFTQAMAEQCRRLYAFDQRLLYFMDLFRRGGQRGAVRA